MRPNAIRAMSHVAIRVTDLDAAVRQATSIMGLRVSDRSDDRVDLTHGQEQYSLQYLLSDENRLDHIGLEANGLEGLREIKARLDRVGTSLGATHSSCDSLEDPLTFEIPGGVPFVVHRGLPKDQPDFVPSGVRPTHFGHVNMRMEDPRPALEFLDEVLDFRYSDWINGGAFMRCNEEHHAVVITPGEPVLHHHAWAVESIADLGRLADSLCFEGDVLVEGPVRHGIGNNIAAYFKGAAGEVVEYYTDMQQIRDDDYPPGQWEATPDDFRWYSRWTQRMPSDEFRTAGIPFPS